MLEFLINPILAGVLVSILAGVLGPLIVANKSVFIAGGIAHGAFGGIGLAIVLSLSPLFGAFVFAVLLAVLLVLAVYRSSGRIDALILATWSFGMSIGIICLDFYGGYGVDLAGYLFGSILLVSDYDVGFLGLFDLILITFLLFNFAKIRSVLFDPIFMRISGVNVLLWQMIIYIFVAIAIVLSMNLAGLILILSLMSMPAYISSIFTCNLKKQMILSSFLASSFVLLGLFFAYEFDLSVGACTTIVGSVVLFLSLIYKRFKFNF